MPDLMLILANEADLDVIFLADAHKRRLPLDALHIDPGLNEIKL